MALKRFTLRLVSEVTQELPSTTGVKLPICLLTNGVPLLSAELLTVSLNFTLSKRPAGRSGWQ